jgi:hypothetical protein
VHCGLQSGARLERGLALPLPCLALPGVLGSWHDAVGREPLSGNLKLPVLVLGKYLISFSPLLARCFLRVVEFSACALTCEIRGVSSGRLPLTKSCW